MARTRKIACYNCSDRTDPEDIRYLVVGPTHALFPVGKYACCADCAEECKGDQGATITTDSTGDEDGSDDYGMSDAQARGHERRQMGICS